MELEQKAEEYAKSEFPEDEFKQQTVIKSLLYGYKQGQKDTFNIYDKEVTDMSNDYSNRLKNLEKENEELKAQIEKMKCCKSEILQRIDESCIGALNEEVRVIFKKWELAE